MRYQLTHPAPMKPAANKPRTPVSTAMQIVESQLIECAVFADARSPDSSSLLVSRREETRNTPLVVARGSLRSGGSVAARKAFTDFRVDCGGFLWKSHRRTGCKCVSCAGYHQQTTARSPGTGKP